MKNETLSIAHLTVSIEGKLILTDVSLSIESGKLHVIMGPNGSGKSTLAYTLMGHPHYKVQSSLRLSSGQAKCKIQSGKINMLDLPPEERAKAGLFLAFQSPMAIPGVSVVNLLRTAYQEIHKDKTRVAPTQNPVLSRRWQASGMSLSDFMKKLKSYATELRIDQSFLERGIHDGFSGGEKKKIEMLEALMLLPKFAIFDEIDTGLDVDALRVVARGIEILKEQGTGVMVITHYQRILEHVTPDVVSILVKGRIVDRGDASLARRIEEGGYKRYEES